MEGGGAMICSVVPGQHQILKGVDMVATLSGLKTGDPVLLMAPARDAAHE